MQSGEVAVRQCLSFGTVVIRTLRAYIISSILPWPAKIKENNLTNQLAIATVSGGKANSRHNIESETTSRQGRTKPGRKS